MKTYFFPDPKVYSKPKVKKGLRKTRKATGEGKMFLTIWAERPHYCTNKNCRKYLGEEPMAHYFAHIRSKGAKNDLRFDKENIVLLCLSCHQDFDFGKREKIILNSK